MSKPNKNSSRKFSIPSQRVVDSFLQDMPKGRYPANHPKYAPITPTVDTPTNTIAEIPTNAPVNTLQQTTSIGDNATMGTGANASTTIGNGNTTSSSYVGVTGADESAALARETISVMGQIMSNRIDDVAKNTSSSIFKSSCIIIILLAISIGSLGSIMYSKIDRFETVFYESANSQIKLLKSLREGGNDVSERK